MTGEAAEVRDQVKSSVEQVRAWYKEGECEKVGEWMKENWQKVKIREMARQKQAILREMAATQHKRQLKSQSRGKDEEDCGVNTSLDQEEDEISRATTELVKIS